MISWLIYRDFTSGEKKVTNIPATKIQMERKQNTDLIKYKINQCTGYIIIIISQTYNEITLCEKATKILTTIFEIERNNIQI